MNSKESEYRQLFLLEATENFEELNKQFISLEKKPDDKHAINSIFRIVHTLKGNAMGMGFEAIGNLAHVMEDVMGEIKNGKLDLNSGLFESLFRANDKLGDLIKAIETGKKVSYLGIKTKLEILLKNNREDATGQEEEAEPEVHEAPTEIEADGESSGETDSEADDAQEQEEEDSQQSITFADVIQIPVKKMDELMNLIGQLIIERDRLIAKTSNQNGNRSEFESLQRISSNLQYSIMNARMVQVGFLFNKFHRIVRDAANMEGKRVDLLLKGTEVEIDRNILKIMSDAMIHLARNAVGHGIEGAEVRAQRGKPERGTITMDARYERDNVVIMVSDDGNGIDPSVLRRKVVEKGMMTKDVADSLGDEDIIMQIFEPGFSNADKVTEISGRGVGMDVVKKAVESIGGQVTVDSTPGSGTTVNLHLPSSLALKGALLFEVEEQEYAVALSYTEAVISLKKKDIHKLSTGLMSKYLEETISVVFLGDLIRMQRLSDIQERGILHASFDELPEDASLDVIVVSYGGRLTGLVIDKLLHQQEIMEKGLPRPLEKTKLLSGTTILGNGNVCPVLDVAAVSDLLFRHMAHAKTA
ncbi:MAG: chemotaxis protein CheA [Bacteroidota bacterium]